MRHLAATLISAVLAVKAPIGADPALAPWFQGLQQPLSGLSCCSLADCRPVDWRGEGDHYEVYLEDRWMPVPPEVVLSRHDNPTGSAIACYTPTMGIMCFVRGSET